MLHQAAVTDVKNKNLTKQDGLLVVTTRYYPRFLKRALIHEYKSALAPSKSLLKEFKDNERALKDHDLAFVKMQYEKKFKLTEEGFKELERLSELSKTKNVYLVCYCANGDYCHRELLMLYAQKHFKAKIGKLSHPYEIYRKRLEKS